MRKGRFYNLVAPLYGKFMPSFSQRLTMRAVQRLSAGAPETVLEVGMGPGHLVRELGAKSSAQIVGVDVAKGMVTQARSRLSNRPKNARFVCADAMHLPFARDTFESVVSVFLFDVLEESQFAEVLSEMGRVLAPGGRIVIGTLHITNRLLRGGWLFAYKLWPDLVGHAKPASVRNYIEDAGFRILMDEDIDEFAGAKLITLVKVVG